MTSRIRGSFRLGQDRHADDLADRFGDFLLAIVRLIGGDRRCRGTHLSPDWRWEPTAAQEDVRGDLLDLVGFEDVAFLQIVEAAELDAAFQAFADFAGVVLLALQRLQRIVADDPTVADHAALGNCAG